LAALIAIISAHTAHAAQTRKVLVTFRGDARCIATVPKEIGVVLDGDERNQFTAERISSNLWIGDWSYPDRAANFNAMNRTASIRVGGSRTDCRRSYEAKDPQVADGWVASFRFTCNTQSAQKLEVRGEPDVPISYVRRLPKADDDEDSRACADYSGFHLPLEIQDVWFTTRNVPSESLRIQIGLKAAKIEAPGLLVNHSSVMKYAKKGSVALDQKKILLAFGEQRAEGLSFSPPLFVSNAYDDDRKRLEKLIDDKKKGPRQGVTVVVVGVK
jgi:hypothetical protein